MINSDITIVISAVAGMITVFSFFQNRMTATEKRLSLLEKNDEYINEKLEDHKLRLDNYDKQTEAIVRMTEQLKVLSEKVDKMDHRLGGSSNEID